MIVYSLDLNVKRGGERKKYSKLNGSRHFHKMLAHEGPCM